MPPRAFALEHVCATRSSLELCHYAPGDGGGATRLEIPGRCSHAPRSSALDPHSWRCVQASFKLACGPRILTFFLYLSDVEEGGGTRFPKIPRPDGEPGGLVVTPRRGHAVVWPSVLSGQPGRVDSRTTHEAMPVVKGLKFAANHWIHDFNFKVANKWGCTGAFD